MNTVAQKGFANLTLYAAIGAGVVILGMSVALRIQTSRLDTVKREYAAFQAQVKAAGEIAEQKARAKEKADLAIKRNLDNENKLLRNNLALESKRLRELNSSSSTVSQLPVATVRPDLACFDRAELDSAIRLYQSDLLGIAEKGAQATLDLDTAKSWVRELK
jgi:hypothetical protein